MTSPAKAGLLAIAAVLGASCSSAEARGGRVYGERGCAVCHGQAGHGDGPSAGRLDVPPRDLADARAYRDGAGPDQIAASIRRGSGSMPPFRDITEDEAKDVAAWIVSLQRAAAANRR